MHVDLDYFYAQCEEKNDSTLRVRPVVVCVYSGRTEESGVVSTANYLARKYGVRAGVPIVRAKKLLESTSAAFLPMNRPLYEQVSDRIMELLRTYGDSFEKGGIDEAYVDLSNKTEGNYTAAEEIAQEFKGALLTREEMTCSVGVAPNKLIAKIASDERKPNGITVVKPEDVGSFLAEMPASRIPGVGKKAEEKLRAMHVETVAQLSALSPTVLIEAFGKSWGSYLYQAARGQDDDPVAEREQPTQFSRIATLKQNTRQLSEMIPTLTDLSNSVASKMKEKGMMCRSVAIIAILTDLSIHSRSKTLEQPTSDGKIIENSVQSLMKEFLESIPAATLRRTGVRVSELSSAVGQTDISKFLSPNL